MRAYAERAALLVVAIAALAGALVAFYARGAEPPTYTIGSRDTTLWPSRDASPGATASVESSPVGEASPSDGRSSPTEPTGALQPTELAAFDFDTLRMNAPIDGDWEITSGPVRVAPVPTTVQRSAELKPGAGMCLPLSLDRLERPLKARLEVMLEPTAAISFVFVVDRERVGVQLLDAAIADGGGPTSSAGVSPQTWHTVRVTLDLAAATLSWAVSTTEGSGLAAEGEAAAPRGDITEFCIDMDRPPARRSVPAGGGN